MNAPQEMDIWFMDYNQSKCKYLYYSFSKCLQINQSKSFYNTSDFQYTLQSCTDGNDSFPNLMVINMQMVIADNWKLITNLNALHQDGACATKVIYVTESYNLSDQFRAEEYTQTIGYFRKPLKRNGVMQTIYSHFGNYIKPREIGTKAVKGQMHY